MSLIDPASEVLVVGKQLLEVHNSLIQESTRDNWCKIVSENSLDSLVNVVSDKGSSIITHECIELGKIDLWQRQHLLAWSSWLLAHHLLLHIASHWTLTWDLITLHVLLLLVVDCFVIAILLLLCHVLLLLLRVLIWTRLALFLIIATSTLSSGTTTIVSSTSITGSVSFILRFIRHTIKAPSLLPSLIVWPIIDNAPFALIHYQIHKLLESSLIFLFLLIFEIV